MKLNRTIHRCTFATVVHPGALPVLYPRARADAIALHQKGNQTRTY